MIRFRSSILKQIQCIQISTRSEWKITDQVGKRGSVLSKMIEDKDKKKKWYFHIMQNTPKSRNVFENVHRPKRRQNVLESLFVKNITDVMSTGDIAPDLVGSGIEIVGVKINPSCREVKVYWQIPPSKFDSSVEYATMLNLKAPQIRAELISRNVLGRVPFIIFVRDISNAYLASFEKALEEADCGPKDQAPIISDEIFTSKKNKLFAFTSAREEKNKQIMVQKEPKPKKFEPVTEDKDSVPVRPPAMKCDVLGINHDIMMSKVSTIKALYKPDATTNVISGVHINASTDLFSNIPGTTIDGKSDREKLLKQFHIQRKMLRKKEVKKLTTTSDYMKETGNSLEEAYEDFVIKEDFIEEESQ